MVKFKDFLDKAKEAAKKGLELAKTQMEFQKLLSDFDEIVGSVVSDILQSNGYRGMRQYEEGGYYVVELAVEDEGKVKHIMDRDIMRHYSPKDREKILNVFPDRVRISVRYSRKGQAGASILSPAGYEDVTVSATLYYFVERKGGLFSKVKRDTRTINLGSFSFKSSDYIDYDNRQINRQKLREYLEQKLRGYGLI